LIRPQVLGGTRPRSCNRVNRARAKCINFVDHRETAAACDLRATQTGTWRGRKTSRVSARNKRTTASLSVEIPLSETEHENSRARLRRDPVRKHRLVCTEPYKFWAQRACARRQLWPGADRYLSPASKAWLQGIRLFAVLASSAPSLPVPSTSEFVLKTACRLDDLVVPDVAPHC